MKSVSNTIPEDVSNVVSRIKVCSRYFRVTLYGRSFGAMRHLPFFLLPNNAAKHAGEEKFGQQSQSIEPFNPTSAAVSQSPINA
jgi:hypothetical protein